ncbi:hypothetical protein [Algibacter pacificus]|uniref:hypothetical protein n=1 Tax=Algibacter pacificus TaxID=2599389 RepID=UPI0011C9CC15|nr:hypothetical protein [Algibacter pacificus]
MKHLLFLLVLTVSINTTKAQDATLQETIDWLKSYGLTDNINVNNGTRIKLWNFILDDNKGIDIRWLTEYKDNDYYEWKDNPKGVFKTYLENIESIELYSGSVVISVKQYYYGEGLDNIASHKNIIVAFDNDNNKEKRLLSLYNALKHLFSFYPDSTIKFSNRVELKNKF